MSASKEEEWAEDGLISGHHNLCLTNGQSPRRSFCCKHVLSLLALARSPHFASLFVSGKEGGMKRGGKKRRVCWHLSATPEYGTFSVLLINKLISHRSVMPRWLSWFDCLILFSSLLQTTSYTVFSARRYKLDCLMAATLSVSSGCVSPHLLLRKQSLCITKQSQSSPLEEKCACFCVDSTGNLRSVRRKCTFVVFVCL